MPLHGGGFGGIPDAPCPEGTTDPWCLENAERLAKAEHDKWMEGGLGGGFLDINQIAGGAQAAWEYGQSSPEAAGIVGMGPTDLTYMIPDPRSTTRKAKRRGT